MGARIDGAMAGDRTLWAMFQPGPGLRRARRNPGFGLLLTTPVICYLPSTALNEAAELLKPAAVAEKAGISVARVALGPIRHAGTAVSLWG